MILSLEVSTSLSRPFSLDEMDKVVADCNRNKSLGQYRVNFAFVKTVLLGI